MCVATRVGVIGRVFTVEIPAVLGVPSAFTDDKANIKEFGGYPMSSISLDLRGFE